ncbi:hypothetical protein ABE208_16200 [Bacillus inaquosorum]|uniref:hypothetical protein n=1 Tax=Bacillus inaquosorum TaxID=483913 RepID=UPI00228303AB|nr:hypothetical protein [Bacillus inaquosorum]MCY9084311.1 hypothetical protein [Bacillus inaquosorum]
MNAETYKKKYSTEEQVLIELKDTRSTLTRELGTFAKSWIDYEILKTLKKESDKFFAISEKKRKKLKAKLLKVKETAPIRVAKYLENDYIWWDKDITKNETTFKLPEKIDLEFKFAIGELGKVLADYKLVEIRYSDSDWIKDILRKKQVRYNKTIYIEHCLELKMQVQNYIARLKDYQQVNENINHLKTEKRIEKIQSWWEDQ